MSSSPTPPEGFRNTARLFPLPNLVLFPHVIQPLHIFEPRYRQLLADALDDDRVLGMALLQPGWEENYHKCPPIHPVICLGRIFQEERLCDGRYNLLLRGLHRARIVEEVKTAKLYRTARVALLEEVPVGHPPCEKYLRRQLGERLTALFAAQGGAVDQVRQLLDSGLPLGSLCDIFGFALPLEPEVKQLLLVDLCIERRTQRLLEGIEACAPPSPPPARRFPPDFSSN
jgi:Lon protease-like protein